MFQRYQGVVWEQRFLPRLTSKQIQDMPKDKALVILSIGAVEQHGPHLPVMTDALIGEATLTLALEKLEPDEQVWMIPPISYGKSNEHIGFAGTISLSASTLQQLVMDIAQSLHASGFRRLLLFNTHGGNTDLLNVVAREIRIATGLMVFNLSPHSLHVAADLISPEEAKFGIHGGDYETSVVKAIKPDWVQDEFATHSIPNVSQYEFLTLEGQIRFAWTMADISHSGISGDATRATPEKGRMIQDRVAEKLAQAFTELSRFEIADVKSRD